MYEVAKSLFERLISLWSKFRNRLVDSARNYYHRCLYGSYHIISHLLLKKLSRKKGKMISESAFHDLNKLGALSVEFNSLVSQIKNLLLEHSGGIQLLIDFDYPCKDYSSKFPLPQLGEIWVVKCFGNPFFAKVYSIVFNGRFTEYSVCSCDGLEECFNIEIQDFVGLQLSLN